MNMTKSFSSPNYTWVHTNLLPDKYEPIWKNKKERDESYETVTHMQLGFSEWEWWYFFEEQIDTGATYG